MRKTPTTLKWLAEARARHAHDLARTERIAAEVNAQLEKLRQNLAGLDRVIQVYDPGINPAKIEPVNATKGRYGHRGALREAVKSALQMASPEWLSTDNLELIVVLELELEFATTTERRRWYMGSFSNLLRKFVVAGIIERQQDPMIPSNEVGRWRWVKPVNTSSVTLAQLRAGADSAQNDGAH